MRGIVTLAALASVLTGCDSKPQMSQAEIDKWMSAPPLDENGNRAKPGPSREEVANRGLDKVIYPKCDKAFAGGKITSCGKRAFTIAMNECRGRATSYVPGGALLDEYSGDSWQDAAGKSETWNDDKRLKVMAVSFSDVSLTQYVAVAMGNGTSDIQHFSCHLDKAFHLKAFAGAGVTHKQV